MRHPRLVSNQLQSRPEGRLSQQRGVVVPQVAHLRHHGAIIRAMERLSGACPGACYLHVGSGPLEEGEQRMVKDLGLADSVTFVGQRDDMPQLLQASDLFLMPSSHEGLPISCLEAMSCGLPVIASDVAGLRDLVVDGQTGLLVHNEDELARAMADLYWDGELRAHLGRSGRARVLEGFRLDSAVASYLALYRAHGVDGMGPSLVGSR